jgi:hypothetical protein
VTGFIDLFHARPMAGELFPFAGLLTTVAAMAGLVPHADEHGAPPAP